MTHAGQITTSAPILGAARNAVEVLLKFKGIDVIVQRKGVPVAKPGGGHDFTSSYALPVQQFAISQVGSDIVEDGADGDTPIVRREYMLTGRYDADLAVDDAWEDDANTYRVQNVNATSGFKTSAELVAFVKVP